MQRSPYLVKLDRVRSTHVIVQGQVAAIRDRMDRATIEKLYLLLSNNNLRHV